MSSNGNQPSSSTSAQSPAINVDFSSIGQRNGESSSQAESRSSGKSSEKKRSESPVQRSEGHVTPEEPPKQSVPARNTSGSIGQRTRKSGGFLLDSVFANGSPRGGADVHGKRKIQDGQLRVDKRRPGSGHLSATSSLRSSPLSREVSQGVALDGPTDETDKSSASRPPSMDTTQLVQMALNLSESRKRHVSNTLRVPSGAERPGSALGSSFGSIRATSSSRQRSDQYVDGITDSSPASSRKNDDNLGQSVASPGAGMENVLYTFSPATLARAEKARKYFELASEHRRLLQSLPALKPGSSATLGRSYNPVQSLRNRRVRLREKRPFPAPPDTWRDVDKVNNWINDVESVTYVDFDPDNEDVHLPTFVGEDDSSKRELRLQPNSTRHRRSDTVGSVITRPENSWTMEPTELLADAYWTEHGDNKAFIETRTGDQVFPGRERPSFNGSRTSLDFQQSRNESIGAKDINDFDEIGVASRRRKLLLPLTGTERRKHRRLISRTSSFSSTSSRGEQSSPPMLRRRSDENIGPLEKHMQELIARDEKGELSNPEASSPEQWPPKFKLPSEDSTALERPHRDPVRRSGGRASLEVPREIHGRSRSADGRFGSVDYSMLPADDDMGSEPASPVRTRDMPSIGMDLSLPSENQSMSRRPRGPTLRSFHPQSKERNKIAQTDFAEASSTNLSPIPSASSYRPGVPTSLDEPSPEEFKRQRTNDSWTNLKRLDTGTTAGSSKDSVSTVGRFLRNRRDRMFRNRERIDAGGEFSAGVSDVSENEESPKVNRLGKRRMTGEDSEGSARPSLDEERPKQRFHLSNLPTFTSSARDRRIQIETPGLLKNDPIGGPVRRPEKFDRLAPPTINLPDGSTPAPDVDSTSSEVPQWGRKSYGQLHPLFGEMARRSLLSGAPTPGISQSKRHWSIYDKVSAGLDSKVTSRDITRVRALLLSSGIKAHEIIRRSNEVHDPPPSFFTGAAATAGQDVQSVPLKEAHVVAANMLADHLATSLTVFEETVSTFRSGPVQTLGTQLEDLRQRATDQLSKVVHDTSDEADAFTIELNTRIPQQTKRVDDAVDEMLRRRRRHLKLLRTTGFKLLEWLVLGILWGIWFLVVVFNIGRKIVVTIYRILHWLLSL